MSSVFASICTLVKQVTPVSKVEITPASRLREDLALDSVAAMELVSLIDDELGLALEMEDVAGLNTIGEIVALAEARLAKSSGISP